MGGAIGAGKSINRPGFFFIMFMHVCKDVKSRMGNIE